MTLEQDFGRMSRPDVFVGGGGVAGVCAAVAAAREGASVLIAERHGFFGGSATAAAVGQFVGWGTASGRRVTRGMAHEIVERLVAAGGASGYGWFVMSTGHRMDRVEYDTEILKAVFDEMIREAGVRVLFHASVAGVRRRDRTVETITLLTKGGMLEICPRTVIDASGDLDLMARAGVEFLDLLPGDALQPATMMFRLGPIDFRRFDAIDPAEKQRLSRLGVERGDLPREALHCSRITGTDEGWFNVTRVTVDGTDPFGLSDAEMEGRRQALRAADFIIGHVPGCETARLTALAPQLGIRETRRIRGEYVLTVEDLRRGSDFPDTVCCGAYCVDIHPTDGAGLRIERFGDDHFYRIPYRCLVPANLDNALVAGRGLSATHEAHGAIRTMPQAMAIGQAAGCAAALAAARNAPMKAVDVARLRTGLTAAGAFLD